MDQVAHSLSTTRGVLDDDNHLSHPYAYSDAVNALEADIKAMGVCMMCARESFLVVLSASADVMLLMLRWWVWIRW